MVRYPFDRLRAVSRVEPLTMNGIRMLFGGFQLFALRYGSKPHEDGQNRSS
jgi:hypothetical protein